ncbi:hypothetical protein SNEBB_011356 [Seison nebaliae]|nr:hypothetical protein SNEBB_011356 [Seison nebaliae]
MKVETSEQIPNGLNEESIGSRSIAFHGIDNEKTPSPDNCSKVGAWNSQNRREICFRCQSTVYPIERIGPVKQKVYHKLCFTCTTCNRQLDLKTYHINQIDLNDREVYCQRDAPKTGKGVFGAEAIGISHVLRAPKLNVMGKVEGKLKPASYDAQALHIKYPMQAQRLKDITKHIQGMHHYPALPFLNIFNIKRPEVSEVARKKILLAQRDLEAQQRLEEEKILESFRKKSKQAESEAEKQVTEEWENRLKEITNQYEQNIKNYQKDDKDALTLRYHHERSELEKAMTLKKSTKKRDIRKTLQMEIQENTAQMVTEFSDKMIRMIRDKEKEILKNVVEEAVGEDNAAVITEQMENINLFATSSTIPPPAPPRRRKRDLYDSPNIFNYVDEQAINVAQSDQTSYTELVDQLIDGLSTDLEKARAIFRWITVKDLNAIDFEENISSDSPFGLLKGIKYGIETYHTLFMRLCSFAGMPCVDIKGHSKSVGYEPGMKITPGKFTNTWNAVLIDGEWRFVQCNWGARHLVMSKDKKAKENSMTMNNNNNNKVESNNNNINHHTSNGDSSSNGNRPSRDNIKYQYDEHYFCPDPEDFILEFFPNDNNWQLLEEKISLQQFERLPFVRSLFFHYHLSFVNQRQAIIQTNQRGACDIKLRMPEEYKERLAFHFHLRLAGKDEQTEFQNVKLERYVLHTVSDDIVSFNVHVPKPNNNYFIEIFASLVDKDLNAFGDSFKLKCICKYLIRCEQLTQRMHPLPSCASGEWGPMKAIRHFGIIPLTHRCAIVEVNYAQLQLHFEVPKASLKFHARLHHNSMTNELNRCCRAEMLGGNTRQLVVTVDLPDEGQYGLDLYARDPMMQTERKTMSHCCKYLINFARRGSPKLGAVVPILQQLGIQPLNLPDPIITTEVPNIDIQFQMTKAVEFSIDLRREQDQASLKIPDHVSIRQMGYTVNFTLTLPNPASYIFTIYAGTEQKDLPVVYTYLINYYNRPVKSSSSPTKLLDAVDGDNNNEKIISKSQRNKCLNPPPPPPPQQPQQPHHYHHHHNNNNNNNIKVSQSNNINNDNIINNNNNNYHLQHPHSHHHLHNHLHQNGVKVKDNLKNNNGYYITNGNYVKSSHPNKKIHVNGNLNQFDYNLTGRP